MSHKYKLDKVVEIDAAIFESRRFIKKASAWKRRLKSDEYAYISGSKEGGAAKRASMDLTRILAELRKP